MNYYYKKRIQVGLFRSEVANYLGIDYKRYELIERGEVKMPKNLIDKFNEMINKGKVEKQIDRLNREELVNNFWNEISNNKEVLKAKMKEFNIVSYNQLGRLLGYKNGCIISIYINKAKEPNFDFKNKLYSFFENELNIQEPKVQRNIKEYEQEEIKWYKTFDIKKWLADNKLNNKEFANYIKMPTATFYYYANLRNTDKIPLSKTIRRVKEGIERYEKEHSIVENDAEVNVDIINSDKDILIPKKMLENENEHQEIVFKYKLINKYSNIVDELSGQATNIVKEISELREKLDDINRQRLIYSELLEDIKGE